MHHPFETAATQHKSSPPPPMAPYIPPVAQMTLEARPRRHANDAFRVLHSTTEAIAHLERYTHHLEDIIISEIGPQELDRRLESLQIRDERNTFLPRMHPDLMYDASTGRSSAMDSSSESLFIPEDHMSSKKRGSQSTEGGSPSKKARNNSSASSMSMPSGLGESILQGPKCPPSDSSTANLSPKTSGKSSVSEQAVMNRQQATTQQMVQRSTTRPLSRRASQSALLPNVHPSSNHHSGSSSSLTARSSQGAPMVQSSSQSRPSSRKPWRASKKA